MYVLRESFTAKPGQASKLAKMFKEILPMGARRKARVLTDAVGQFNSVVIETEVDSMSDLDNLQKEYETRTDIRDRMKGYTDLYETGRREIYKVV